MGASAWDHFGPYHPDPVIAFRLLCQKVFVAGEYWYGSRPPSTPPQSIKALIMYMSTDGTHSVLDYYRPEDTNYTYLHPFSDQLLLQLFGTTHPTHEIIEAHKQTMWERIGSGELTGYGTCITVYKDDQPNEIFVIGASGD